MSNLKKKLRLGILVSGRGSNLQAIIDATKQKSIDAEIAIVISDRPRVEALERAARHGIPSLILCPEDFSSREAFEGELVLRLRSHEVDTICLAGFMRLVGPLLLRAFPNRILNIHPALLPAFPGLHAQAQALAHGVKVTGCTVHFVDEKTDHGPIIRQAAVEVQENDTVETLAARILTMEHRMYLEAIQLLAEGRLIVDGRRVRVDTTPHPKGEHL